jgi:hypothetical protein
LAEFRIGRGGCGCVPPVTTTKTRIVVGNQSSRKPIGRAAEEATTTHDDDGSVETPGLRRYEQRGSEHSIK